MTTISSWCGKVCACVCAMQVTRTRCNSCCALPHYACIGVCVRVCRRYQTVSFLPATLALPLSAYSHFRAHTHSVSLPCDALALLAAFPLSRSLSGCCCCSVLFTFGSDVSSGSGSGCVSSASSGWKCAHNSFCGFIVCLCPFVLPCKCADKNKICKTFNESRYRHTGTHTHTLTRVCVCLRVHCCCSRCLFNYLHILHGECIFSCFYFLCLLKLRVVVASCFCSCVRIIFHLTRRVCVHCG